MPLLLRVNHLGTIMGRALLLSLPTLASAFPVQVLDGGKGVHPATVCITDPAETNAHGEIIAAQVPTYLLPSCPSHSHPHLSTPCSR